AGNGTWEFSTDGGGSFNPIGAVSDAQALLLRATDLVRYIPDSANGETATLGYRAWDQTGASAGQQGTKVSAAINGGTSAFSAGTDTVSLTVTPVNDAPAFTSAATANVAENSTGALALAAADVDLPAQTLTFSITGGADQALFQISGGNQLQFKAAPDFENPTDAGADNVYDVQLTVDDGNGGTAVQNVAITVTPVNDNLPAFTSSATPAVNENTAAVVTLAATDSDLPAQTLGFAITGGADQALFQIVGGNQLQFKAAPDFESPLDAGANNVYEVQVTASDGAGGSTVQNLSVTVAGINDNDPVFTSSATPSVVENTTAVVALAATDADLPAQTVTFSIVGGVDQAAFQIIGNQLQFKAAPDFETPSDTGADNVYDVQVQADDGNGRTTVQNVAVTVTDVGPLVVTSPAAFSLAENSTAVGSVVGVSENPVTYSISGGPDAARFQIDLNTGALSFKAAPDFENPQDVGGTAGDNVYQVQVTADDGATTQPQLISVTVSNANDAPVLGGAVAGQAVNDNATLTPFGAVTIADQDQASGGLVTVTVTLDAAAKGTFTGASLTTSGFADKGGGAYALSNVTASAAQAAIRLLAYDPADNRVAPGLTETTTFTVAVDDGTVTVTDGTTTVISTSANDAPVLGGAVAGQAVNDTATVGPFSALTITDADVGETDLSVTVTLDTAAKGAFTGASLTASGFTDQGGGVYSLSGVSASAAQAAIRALVFDPSDNRVAPGSTETTTFTVAVDDGDTTTNNATTTVVSTSVNDAPVLGGAVAGQAVNDNATISPFSGFTIADADTGENDLTVTVTLDTAAKGVFTGASLTASGFTDQGGGVYSRSGLDAATAQTAIRALVFNPADSRVLPTQTETTTFTVAVNDGGTTTNNATTTVVSTSVNDAPTAVADTFSVSNVATGFVMDVVGGTGGASADLDPDLPAETLAVVSVTDTTLGTVALVVGNPVTLDSGAQVTLLANGRLSYNANAGFGGLPGGSSATDVFQYTITDSQGVQSTATVTANVVTNAPPVAVADTAGPVTEDATLTIAQSALLSNDTDAEEVPAFSGVVSPSANGALVTVSGSDVIYDPRAAAAIQALGRTATGGQALSDTFTYQVTDGVNAPVSGTVTVTVTGANDAPVIGGFADPGAINDTATVNPFAAVTISDVDVTPVADTQTVTVTLDAAGKGAFTAGSLAASGFVDSGGGVYTFSGTASAAQVAIRQLVYNPADNRVAPGSTETTTFTVAVNDGLASVTNATTDVVSTSVNDAPVIGGAVAGQVVNDTATVSPFSALTVTDADTGETDLTVTVTLDTAAKGAFTSGSLTASGFTDQGGGIYSRSGLTAAAAQTAIRALVFDPSDNRVAPGSTETTTFTVDVDDGTTTTNNATTTVVSTSVNDAPVVGGAVAGQAVNDTATVGPFSALTITDADVGETDLSVTVTLDTAAKGAFTGASLTASGFTDQGGGVYSLSGVSASAAQAAIRALVFDPSDNRVAPGSTETTTFTVAVDDGDTTTNNATTTVVSTSVNDAPVLGGAVAGQAVNDNATISPFSGFTIADADTGENDLTVTVTLDTAAKGVFTGASLTASGFTDQGGGVYSRSGLDAATAQTAIRALVFNPADSRVLPTQTETTTFTVAVNDGGTTTNNATTTVVSTSVNDAPTAVADTFSVSNVATGFVMDVVGGTGGASADLDPDLPAETLAVVSVTDTTLGTVALVVGNPVTLDSGAQVTLLANGRLSYNANAGFGGLPGGSSATDVFQYTITDSQGVQSTATVTANVVTNAPPVAVADTAGPVTEDATLTIAQSALLSNDTDAEEVPAFSGVVSPSANGALVTVSGSDVIYDPRAAAAIQALGRTATGGQALSDTFTYQVTDGVNAPVSGTVTVTVTGANDAPVIGGFADPGAINDTATVNPFAAVTISDVDVTPVADTQTVTVTLDAAGKGAFTAGSLAASGFVDSGGGVYTFSGTASAAQVAIRQLVYNPADNRVAPGSTETTTFTVAVNDGLASVTNATTDVVSTSVNDAPVIGGAVAGQAVNDTATVSPFSTLTIADADQPGGDLVTVTVTLDTAAKGVFTGASLTASGFVSGGGGVYTLSNVTASAAQAAIRALVFDPSDNRVAPGSTETTTFTVAVDDGDTTTNNATTTVVSTSVNDAPVVGGAVAGQAVNDTATVSPFSTLTITDADTGENDLTVTVTLDTAAKGAFTAGSLTASGFTDQGGGVYSRSGLTAAAAQTAIRALVFNPTDNRVAPGSTETTTFTVAVNDGVTTTNNATTTVVSTSVNDAPAIGGAVAGQAVNDTATVSPFSALTIADADTGENDLTVTVTLDTAAKGAFTGASLTASGFTDQGGGVYSRSGLDAATAQTAIRALVFNPTDNRVAPGSTETTTFTVDVDDGDTTTSNATTTVVSTSVNDAPVIGGAVAGQAVNDTATASPFSALTITDADTGENDLTVTVTLDTAAKGAFTGASLTASGFVDSGGGAYTLTGVDAAAAQAAIRALVFNPSDNRVAPGTTETTTFTVGVNDGNTTTNNATTTVVSTSVNDTPVVGGAVVGQAVNDNATVSPFSTLTIADADQPGGDLVTVTVTMDVAAKGVFTPGSLTASGFTDQTGGVYRLANVTASAAQAAIRQLSFDPSDNRVAPGLTETTTFTVDVDDGDTTTSNATTTVISTSVNEAPAVAGAVAGQAVNDTATLSPFSTLTIADSDPGETDLTVTVTLDAAAKGAFTGASLTASGFTDQGGGVYSRSGLTPAQAQAAVRQLVFDPTDNRVAPGLTETTTFTVAVDDGDTTTNNATTTVVSTSVNDAPVLGGAVAGQAVNDTATVSPFSALTIADADTGENDLTVTVTLDTAAKGAFTGASLTASGFTDQGGGVYSRSGLTAATAQTAIRALVFNPADNRVAPGSTETTTFTVAVNDGTTTTNNATTTVVSTSVNDAPVIGGAVAGQAVNDTATVSPFSTLTIADADQPGGDLVTVTVTLDTAAKGVFTGASLTASGFVSGGGGVYTLSNVTASAAQAAIRALVFDPSDNRVAPGSTETTTFTVAVDDGDTTTNNATTTVVSTSVNDAPVVGGAVAGQAVNDTATVSPFSTLTITDADTGENDLTVTVTLDTAAKGAFTAGSLTASGFTDQGGGVYSRSGLTAAAAQTAIRALVFNPTDNRVAPGSTETTTFTVAVNDGVTTTNNATTTVVSTSVNDAPAIGGAVAGQAVNDTATVSPFSALTIADADTGENDLTVTVTLDTAAKGAFTGASLTASGFTDQGGGVYSRSGLDAATAQTAIRALVFNPTDNRVAPGSTETTTFTVDVDDGDTTTSNATTTVVSTSVNDAPTLTAAAPAIGTTDEDTTSTGILVSSILGASLADPDPGAVEGIAITGKTGAGTWEFSVNGGGAFAPIGTVSGTTSLLLRATDLVRYVPNGIDGESPTLTYRGWDQSGATAGQQGTTANTSTNGAATAFSTATDTGTLTVTSVNDAPTITAPAAVATQSGVPITFSVAGGTSISLADIDIGAGLIQVQLTSSVGDLTLPTTAGLSFVFNDGNGTGAGDGTNDPTMTFRGTLAAVNTALNGLVHGGIAVSGTLTINISDLGNTGVGGPNPGTDSTTVAVNVNALPVINNLATNTLAYTEGDGARVIDQGTAATVTDLDSPNFDTGTLTVSIIAGGDTADDVLGIRNQGTGAGQIGVSGANVTYEGTTIGTFAGGSGGSALVITFNANATSGAAGAVSKLVQNITYTNTDAGDPSASSRTVRFVVTDGEGATSTAADTTVTIARVNDAPTFASLGGTPPTFTEGGAAVRLDTNVTIADAELDAANNYAGASVTIERTGAAQAEDVFAFNTSGASFNVSGANLRVGTSVFGTFTSTGGTMTINFTSSGTAATSALVDEVLQRVTYSNSNGNPPPSVTLDWSFSDGNTGGQGTTLLPGTATGSSSVTITAANDAPVFTNLGGTVSYTENAAGVVADSNVTIADAEFDAANDYQGATLTVNRSGGANAQDVLGISTAGAGFTVSGGNLQSGGLTFASLTSSSGTLTISFTSSGTAATSALVDDVLQHVTYSNSSDAPPASVTLAWSLTDGTTPATGTTTVSITAQNDAPTLDATKSPALNNITQGAGAPSGSISTVGGTLVGSLVDFSGGGGLDNVTDPDSGALLGIAITGLNGTNGTWWYTTNNGATAWTQISTPSSLADSNALLLIANANTGIYFQPNAGFSGTIGNAVTFRAWDRTGPTDTANGTIGTNPDASSNGGTTAYSAVADTASLTVNASASGTSTITLSSLNGTAGFKLNGGRGSSTVGFSDVFGSSIASAGDVNGDGFEDILVGALDAEPAVDAQNVNRGQSYVVFGNSTAALTTLANGTSGFDIRLLNGSNGVAMSGPAGSAQLGATAAGGGDVNGDGLSDVLVGELRFTGPDSRGYVVYGD
ncbi:MAG: Ig-like domain-containing protein, partial [Gammaproteobacteria bacterium]